MSSKCADPTMWQICKWSANSPRRQFLKISVLSCSAFIFGLSEDQGKNAIDRNCRQLFLRAESRRLGKTIMFVKGKGPIVFSDSSDDGQSDKDDEEMDAIATELAEDGEDGESTVQANKRLKMS